jgi:glycerol kinase
VHRLSRGGRFVVDPCNASRTLLWDLHTRDWSAPLLELFGIPRDILPDTVPNRFPFGDIEVGTARIPLVVVTGDQSAVPFAGGAPDRNAVYMNMGTGAFVQRLAKEETGAPARLLHSLVFMDGERLVFMDEGTVNGAGSAIAAEAGRAGLSQEEVFAELRTGLESANASPLFLNGVSGLGSPWWIPAFPSRMAGEGSPRQRLVAVAESIVFLLYRNFVELLDAGSLPRTIVATGGLARLDGLCRRLASLSGCEVERPAHTEATARGLAWLTAGGPDGWARGACDVFRPQAHPDPVKDRYSAWLDMMERAIGAL